MFNDTFFDSIIADNLRSDFKKPKFLALLECYLKPIFELYQIFSSYQILMLDKISHNGQIIYLQHRLNQLFNIPDPLSLSAAVIYIQDVANIENVYVANDDEGYDPIYIGNSAEAISYDDEIYVGNDDEYQTQVDFYVMVPNTIYLQLLDNSSQGLNNMKAVINYYKIAGKRYQILSL